MNPRIASSIPMTGDWFSTSEHEKKASPVFLCLTTEKASVNFNKNKPHKKADGTVKAGYDLKSNEKM